MSKLVAPARQKTVASTPASRADVSAISPLQRQVDASSRQNAQKQRLMQLRAALSPEDQPNRLPPPLRSGIEALSGMDVSDVVVHRNSSKPAQLNALAYAQGNEIHLGAGQDKHLPHEAWHVVQQRQGRVKPTAQLAGVALNDNAGLEREADVMGARALRAKTAASACDLAATQRPVGSMGASIQRYDANVLQRYKDSKRFKTSESDHYRVDKNGTNEVGVKNGAAVPNPQNLMVATGKTWYGFERYQYNGHYENDCLQFAQHLAREIAGIQDGSMFKVSIAGVPMDFAVNGSHTQAADQNFGQNGATNPDVGEAYGIVPKSTAVVTGCSFHIATVVAKDGGDNVTCEADAGDAGRTEPVFDIYDTDRKSSFTFHATYKTSYGGNKAVTGTLAL